MNTSNTILFAALLTSFYTSSNYPSGWFDFDALEDQIKQQMESMRHMRKQCMQQPFWPAPSYQHTSMTTSDKNAIITLADIDGDNIEARLNDANNRLTITTPIKKFTIATRGNIIFIEAQEVIHSQREKKEGVAQFYGTSIDQTQTSVSGLPLLEKRSIDYNPDTKELIITIPFQEIQHGKIVPINKLKPQAAPKTDAPVTLSQTVPTEK